MVRLKGQKIAQSSQRKLSSNSAGNELSVEPDQGVHTYVEPKRRKIYAHRNEIQTASVCTKRSSFKGVCHALFGNWQICPVSNLKCFTSKILMTSFFRDCFEWESKVQSFAALLVWLVLCYYFQPWMLPVGALLIFLKQYIIRQLAGPNLVPWDEVADSDLEDEDDDQQEKEEKKSLKERLQTIQDVTQGVQNAIGKIASLLESVKK